MTPDLLSSRRRRRGSFLLEAAAGGALLAVACMLALRLVGWVAADRREADRRQTAVELASNALERLAAGPPGSWADRTEPMGRSHPELAPLFPGGTVAISSADAELPGLKRVSVEVRWAGASGPVRLSAWLSTRRGATP